MSNRSRRVALPLSFAPFAALVLAWALASPALAQGDPPPEMAGEDVLTYVPVLNGTPSKDDPPSRLENGVSTCGMGENFPGDSGLPTDANDTGDPVALHNGMVSYRAVDMMIPGRGIEYQLARRYNSKRSHVNGPLGYGWDHSYNIWLHFSGSNRILWNGNNREGKYTLSGGGGGLYTSPRGTFSLLREFGGTYTLRDRHGSESTFNTVTVGTYQYGRLASIADRNGNTLTFSYYATGTTPQGLSRLSRVGDAMGRGAVYNYDSQGRVTKVTDFAGRVVTYTYDSAGNLSSARSPKVLFACIPHMAPLGRIERYQYYSGTGLAEIDHNLWKIIRPNQAQYNPTNGTPAVVFNYNQDSGNWRYDWCTSQVLGDPANGVGGTITYAYASMNIGHGAGQPDKERLEATVTDRNSNVTKYQFNEYGHCVRQTELLAGGAQAVTKFKYDISALHGSEGLVTEIEYPRGNKEERTYVTTGNRWQQGNVSVVKYLPGLIASDQAQRILAYQWEPVSNHLYRVTDERGHVREFLYDWMEGSETLGPNYVTDDVALELGITEFDAAALILGMTRDADLNGDGQQVVLKGNLVQRVEPTATLSTLGTGGGTGQQGREGDTAQQAVTTWTHNAYGQQTSMTDAEENVSVFLYYTERDPDGDGTINYAAGNATTGGYLRRVVEDTALPFVDPFGLNQLAGVSDRPVASDLGRNSNYNPTPTNATTDYGYTPFGYQNAVIDARGVKHQYHRNDVGEIWAIIRSSSVTDVAARKGGLDPLVAEDLTGQDYAYTELICHDFNGNAAECRVQNSGNDPDHSLAGWLESFYSFDILNDLVSESHEYGTVSTAFATTTCERDANQNLIEITQPEGNRISFTYDARDLLLTTTRGVGTALASTEERTLDLNGNVTAIEDGAGHTTTFAYDGYDRLKSRIEPVGTVTTWTYDESSNATSVLVNGKPDGSSAPRDLSRADFAFDEMSRAWRVDRSNPDSGTPALSDGVLTASDGEVSTRIDHDRLGRRTFIVEDDAKLYETRYDGSSRPLRSVDPLSNQVEIGWDDNSNPIKIIESERYPNATTRSFETYFVYDSLNRRTSATDNLGNTTRFAYDSRDNVVASSDAKASLIAQTINGRQVNGPGNTRRYRHDGLDRLILEESDLRVGGTGDGAIETSNSYNADGKVTLKLTWDKNNRLTSRIDDKNNTTSYEYDALNRQSKERLADLSEYVYSYSLNDTLGTALDPNGTMVVFGFDGSRRLTSVHVDNLGTNVVGTTEQRFEYDGRHRRTKTVDSVDGAIDDGDDWVVTRAFDALGRIISETQNGRTIASTWTEEAERTSVTYPSGLALTTTFDVLDRVSAIKQGVADIAVYSYAGPGRVLERANGNGTSSRYHDGSWNDTAYFDGARRPTRLDHVVTATSVLQTGFEHAYDRVGNRLYERRLHDGGRGDNYVYDSLYRLVTFERLVPSVDVGVPNQGNELQRKDWRLDGVQNWRELITDGLPKTTSVNAVNEYTAFGVESPDHDANGNLVAPDTGTSPAVSLRYDFLNRLREVTKGGATPQTIAHDYDAEGRRVRTTASGNIVDMPMQAEFAYDGWEELEEWNKPTGSGSFILSRRYVQGRALDEPVRLENFTFYPGTGTYYYQQSTLGNVAALTDEVSGAVVERYSYDAYGAPQFETSANNAKAIISSDYGNAYLFQGRRFEAQIYALYDFRARCLDVGRGRFLQRDPIGTWGDGVSIGSAHGYVGNNAPNLTDSTGTLAQGPAAPARPVARPGTARPGGSGGGGIGPPLGETKLGWTPRYGPNGECSSADELYRRYGAAAGGMINPSGPGFDPGRPTFLGPARPKPAPAPEKPAPPSKPASPGSGGDKGGTGSGVGDIGVVFYGMTGEGGGVLPLPEPIKGVVTPDPKPEPSAAGAGKGGRNRVRDAYDKLKPGNSDRAKLVGNDEELQILFSDWIQGGTLEYLDGKLTRYKLPDGSTVQLRGDSKSGGRAIDIQGPGSFAGRVHVDQP